ncbi:MAG: hypothetical protein ACT4PO_03210 [Actinomycetota bacterium]
MKVQHGYDSEVQTMPTRGPEGPHTLRARTRIATPSTLLIVVLVLAAANLHILLTPEHFREGPQFGLFFLAADIFQVWLAFALLLMPGPRVYRTGLWGSAGLVAIWMITRLIPPPGAASPEPVELLGVVATSLEIAAIVGLVSTLPAVGPPPTARTRRTLAGAIGAGFAALVLLASGVVTVIPPGKWTGPSFLFRMYPLPSWRLTGIWIVVAGRWSVLIPWVTIGFVALASFLVAQAVSLALRLPAAQRCSVRRRGLFAALPAVATVPVCCGAPVAAVAGGVTVGALFRWTPVLMGVSLILLSAHVFVLERRIRRSDRAQGGVLAVPTQDMWLVTERHQEPPMRSRRGRLARPPPTTRRVPL